MLSALIGPAGCDQTRESQLTRGLSPQLYSPSYRSQMYLLGNKLVVGDWGTLRHNNQRAFVVRLIQAPEGLATESQG